MRRKSPIAEPLTEGQRSDFFKVATKGARGTIRKSLDRYLQQKNRFRWWRLKRDFAWAQRMAKRANFNEEDVRWLL